jgi:Tol biopolymer transport system component
MLLTIGDRLGPYEVLGAIGAGGMGEVYRARDTKLGRDVALKILPDAFAQDPERLARFEREARTLAALNHPHIAQIYGVEDSSAVRALVMELVEGPTLAERIARGPVPLTEMLALAQQIAEAIEAAHEQGILHRDLKPANVKVRPDGVVKVLDFGLAKALSTGAGGAGGPGGPGGAGWAGGAGGFANSPTLTSPALMTGAGVILGTAAYMSPEQATGDAADKRSDLWSFGVVLMEMLTGRPVFTGQTVSHVLASVLKSDPDWTSLPAETPAPIRKLLRRCLEKDRKRRLDSAAAARLEIEEASSAPIEATPALVPVRVLAGRREAVAWTLAGLVLVAAISVGAWQLRSRPQPVATAASQFVIPPPDKLRFEDAPAISPDGRTIVFVASGDDRRSLLWVRPLDALTSRPLAGTDGAVAPFWSPDSRFIGFFAQDQLKKVDAGGGPPQVVTRVGSTTRYASGSWSRDGVIVFSSLGQLFRVSAAGGTAVSLTDGKERWGLPYFLPDGRHFLSTILGASPSVYVRALDSNEAKLVGRQESTGAAKFAPPGHLLFNRGSTLMAQPFDATRLITTAEAVPVWEGTPTLPGGRIIVSVSDNGALLRAPAATAQTQLEWVDRRGTRVSLAAGAAVYGNVTLSPDGARIAFDRAIESGLAPDVWLMDLQRRITSRFTFSPDQHNVPLWSPDGRTVAFATITGTAIDIGQRPSNASGPAEILLKLSAPPFMFPSDWSADGRFLAYYRSDPKTQLDLWVLPLAGDRQPIPLLHSEFNESQGQFSPDGKWMAYVSDESGTPQVYVQSFPTLTGKWQVSPDGGSQPRWRRDGKELFYLAPDRKLMAATVKTGQIFESEAPHALFGTTLEYGALRQTYSVSADGQRFLLNTPADTVSSPMTIVLNWTALLKR